MLRRYWLLVALLLPFLALSGGSAGNGFASETELGCQFSDSDCLLGEPLDQRHAIVSDANESADEDGPPNRISRTSPSVVWTHEFLVGSGCELVASYIGEAPIVHAARPRAPPYSL